jgi:hypothetical protein
MYGSEEEAARWVATADTSPHVSGEAALTSTLGICQPVPIDLQPPTLQTIPEAIDKNIAIARARTRSRIMAVVKADGYGHGAITVRRSRSLPEQNGSGRQKSQRP